MKAKEYYALVKEGIEAGTATALKGAVDEMFMGMNREVRELQEKRHIQFDRGIFSHHPRWLQEFLGCKNAGVRKIHMNQNEKHNEVIVGICHDAVLLTEIWGAFQKLFEDYVEEVIAALTPVAEALAGPILFGNEAPGLSEEEINRIIRTVDDGREQDVAPKKRVIKPLRCPLKASNHYNYIPNNYIPRTPKNLPYQRRAF